MTLSSPDYPNWYKNDGYGCEWLISAPVGFIIALEFNHFDVSNLLDLVRKFVRFGKTICFDTFATFIFPYISFYMSLTLSHSMMEFVMKLKN